MIQFVYQKASLYFSASAIAHTMTLASAIRDDAAYSSYIGDWTTGSSVEVFITEAIFVTVKSSWSSNLNFCLT